ncbi:YccF domain-containing protein [Haematospirillum jordaniae]|uniref:Inner membrane protein YccF n=1 Tax=Haematospirillum jordaniae TaxID=1549855 RepID=A0A143DG84_9PROT|nr:YccF domain-containing protein [Haematospirillum jordaniae]AMW35303.1 hypothetical protein AY555_09090 [Haematospirillum jordaniae]NKD45133.1 YccF domain-containing protein [Haematospirillum jordaniae]NKD56284.1 YccF domain-containing protein [Haematospirillum jordaniae]NKD58341.1 YccF domain-containing protein [Haematospirillum jordaniae]NKD66490.1 YccF domain-containing protein [Haematospirillum jordaniae]
MRQNSAEYPQSPDLIVLVLNVAWVVFGGFVMFLGWVLAACLMALTIVGIPWVRSSLNIAFYSLWPFGRMAVDRQDLYGERDIGTGVLGLLGNVLWFVLAGWWLALGHISSALACAITLIGLPLAWAHLKLAWISIFPVGKAIVEIPKGTGPRL